MTYLAVPVDSTDARERREAEADAAAAEVLERRRHAETCQGGWLGEDAEGRPIACLRCRPRLAAVKCWTCQVPAALCEDQVQSGGGRCCEDCDHRSHVRRSA